MNIDLPNNQVLIRGFKRKQNRQILEQIGTVTQDQDKSVRVSKRGKGVDVTLCIIQYSSEGDLKIETRGIRGLRSFLG